MNLWSDNPIAKNRWHITLLAILITSLVLQLSVWTIARSADPLRFWHPDSRGYHNSALALTKLAVFAASPETPAVPQTVRTPGYPAFLAGIYSIFGEDLAAAITFQILLSLGTVVLVFKLANDWWTPRVALLATVLFMFHIGSFFLTFALITETLFTFLITAMAVAGLRLLRASKKEKWALLMGILLGLATLVRPISYYYVIPLVLGILILGKTQRWHSKTMFTVLTLVVLPYSLLIGSWQVRNYHLTGSAEFSGIQGLNMLFYRGAAVVALRDGISFEEAQYQLGYDRYELGLREEKYKELHPETRNWSKARLTERWKEEGMALIIDNPILFVRTQMTGSVDLLLSPAHHNLLSVLGIPVAPAGGPLGDLIRLAPKDYMSKWSRQPVQFLAFLWEIIHLLILYIGILYWLWHRARARSVPAEHLFIWGTIIYFVVISAGPEANYRFRSVIIPLLIPYAAKGLSQILNSMPDRLSGHLLGLNSH